MTPPLRADVHQHLWPAELLEVERLAPKEAAPLLRAWGGVVAGLPEALGAWASAGPTATARRGGPR
jgi:hypothetical protein